VYSLHTEPATKTTSSTDQVEYAQYRANLYSIAARAFAEEPTKDTLAVLTALAEDTHEHECRRTSEFTVLVHMGNYKNRELPSLQTQIGTEYAELFIGPRPPLAPLYESLYVGSPRRLFTDVTEHVRTCYESHGFTVLQRNKIPDDHMAYELEFMSRLCQQEKTQRERGNTKGATWTQTVQLEFIEAHLGRWAHAFATRIAEAWCGDYYVAWSRFVADFVEEERAYLMESLASMGQEDG
jgi:TorA maturation chaperone TorD